MPTYNQFDWAYPDFSSRPSEPSPYEAVQRAKQTTRRYASKAPKKTLRKKPRNNAGSYQWDKGMTFAEKAGMLAASGVLGNKVRKTAFLDDFDRYVSPTDQVMEYLKNASPHVQKYYGVYDDIQSLNSEYGPYPLSNVTVVGGTPATSAQRTAPRAVRNTSRRPSSRQSSTPVVPVTPPMGVMEQEELVPTYRDIDTGVLHHNVPLLNDPEGTDAEWRKWNPTTAMASYQADAALHRPVIATVPMTGVQIPQYGWGGWLLPF